MGTIADALAGSGTDVRLSMFVVAKDGFVLDPGALSLEPASVKTGTYVLDNEEDVLAGRRMLEYDFTFAEMPPALDALLARCLRAARASGAEVAWFGFEGTYSYEDLLTGQLANQIYAVIDAEGLALASDATLTSRTWRERIVRAGDRARSGSAVGPRGAPFVTVYVQLLGEGTVVLRPVLAELLISGHARLLTPSDYDPEDETWEFNPGAVVRIERRPLGGREVYMAVALAG